MSSRQAFSALRHARKTLGIVQMGTFDPEHDGLGRGVSWPREARKTGGLSTDRLPTSARSTLCIVALAAPIQEIAPQISIPRAAEE